MLGEFFGGKDVIIVVVIVHSDTMGVCHLFKELLRPKSLNRRKESLVLYMDEVVTGTQDCCDFQSRFQHLASSTSQDMILHDFYKKNVLQTKCHRFPTFGTFLELDVSSDCKIWKSWLMVF